jgi:hypothetical protein
MCVAIFGMHMLRELARNTRPIARELLVKSKKLDRERYYFVMLERHGSRSVVLCKEGMQIHHLKLQACGNSL